MKFDFQVGLCGSKQSHHLQSHLLARGQPHLPQNCKRVNNPSAAGAARGAVPLGDQMSVRQLQPQRDRNDAAVASLHVN